MPPAILKKPATFIALTAAVLCQAAAPVCAQQLSIRHYDVSDGLANSHIADMHQDAKGYLWLATWEGVSRFDGYHFTNYGTRDGLRHPVINAVVEDPQNGLWIATNGHGVAHLVDDPEPSSSVKREPAQGARQKFDSFQISDVPDSNVVNALLFDSQHTLWCATDGGLYRASSSQTTDLNFELVKPYKTGVAFADSQGRLWFGIPNGLLEIVQGQIIEYAPGDEVVRYPISKIIEDHQGRLFVSNAREVFEFIAPAEQNGHGRWRKYPLTFRPDQGINTLLSDSAGTLWIGTWNGLVKFRDGRQTLYTSAQGLTDNSILALAEDRQGNLWIGTEGGGLCKLSSELIISFTRAEGLPNQNVRKVIEDREGHIFASIQNGGLVRIDEEKAVPIAESQMQPFSDFNERIIQDQRGDWWIGTGEGLFCFQGPGLQLHRGHKLAAANGIVASSIEGLYQDPTGKVWISPGEQGLGYFDLSRKGNLAFERIPLSAMGRFPGVLRLISDPSGTLWLGAHWLLGRLIKGQVVMLEPADGLPETNPRCFFIDSRGWLWIGLRFKGVSVTKDPTAQTPTFVNYSTAGGLASDAVWAIAEDEFGRMYFGTGKGLDQLDLATGRIRHFNTDDGLSSDVINDCFKDRRGNIWVATTLGLSKFNPHAERTEDHPAPVYLSRVQVAGEELSLPETGARSVGALDLPALRNNLLIEYVAVSFEGEDKLRYQYKLEGVDNDWSVPAETRSINYARLAPGSYQFLVRSINQEGLVSDAASFRFRILPPLWQRWWFLTLGVVLLGLAVYAAHRSRVARLVELERVRTRIASDLHDDIGANLSLIAMLSDVARGNLKGDDQRMKEWFSTIASTSRDTVDAMSDIVWAVNPGRDHLRDLTQRMRRFAEDLLSARGIELEFRAPDSNRDVKVGADLRRETFLILKEVVNNIARHSECTLTVIDLRIEHAWLVMSIQDNGCGFDLEGDSKGNGLASMRRRAERLGGNIDVNSTDGSGTSIILRIPLEHGREPRIQIAPDS